MKNFINYFLTFYGTKGLYPIPRLRRSEIKLATQLRMATADFEGDSFDREAVRDIILAARN